MEIIRDIGVCREIVEKLRSEGCFIGFVPTMGFLHEGHLSLIRRARKECDRVFISIFVNPTQFGPGEDFKKYPRDLKKDKKMAGAEGTDYIFIPEASAVYGRDHKTFIEVKDLGKIMCGRDRPDHFRGVATIVCKLFNILKAHRAYFGEKDFQKLVILKKMARDLDMDIELASCPTVREADGLALSSRNKYLSPEERKNAVILYNCLKLSEQSVKNGEKDLQKIKAAVLEKMGKNKYIKKVHYFDFRDPLTLNEKSRVSAGTKKILAASAVQVGSTRLIDNIVINIKE